MRKIEKKSLNLPGNGLSNKNDFNTEVEGKQGKLGLELVIVLNKKDIIELYQNLLFFGK